MLIRYSMIQSWLTCPKNFYDTFVLNKIQTERSSATEFGTAVHLGIRTTLEGENGVEAFSMYWGTLKDVRMTYYGDSWQGLKELGEHFLNTFKSRHAKKFSEFQQEVKMDMPFLGHTLQGTADYIGLYEGKLTIADWKTSSKPYRKNKILLNPQMYLYSKLYQYKTGKLPDQIMYKVFNKKDGCINTIEKKLTQQYVDAIVKNMEHAIRGMIETAETGNTYHGADCYCEGL